MDDIDGFFKDLAAGLPISLIVDPAMRTNFPQWKQILAYLRLLGVQKIYDASLGADICVWAYLRYWEEYKPQSLISQTCPVLVSYCETHHPELLAHLSPIHSPMGCTAVYMRNYEGLEGKIAAISPCIAKTKEFEDIGIIDYNITFAKLEQYLEKNIVNLPKEETGFDHDENGLGSLFPMPGGFCENIEFFLGKSFRIDKAQGPDVFKRLDIYAETDDVLRPRLFEVLSCTEGCNIGSGGVRNNDFFRVRTIMDTIRQTTLKQLPQ
jgi:iron only hydrogenase large subunit-like protein